MTEAHGDAPDKTEKAKSSSKRQTIVVVVLIVVLLFLITVIAVAMSNNTTTSNGGNTSSSSSTNSPAYQLADEDLGYAPDSATVAQYQSALDALKPYCKENEASLAAEIHETWKLLEQSNIKDETNLTLLQHIQQSIPSNAPVEDCSQVMGAYVTLRQG